MSGKIARLSAYALHVPLDRPLPLSNQTITARDYVVVEVRDADGNLGRAIGYSRGAPVETVIERMLVPTWDGAGLDDYAALCDRTVRTHTMQGSHGIFWRAVSLADCAVHDLLAIRAGLPLAEFLGGKVVPVPATLAGCYPVAGETPDSIRALMSRMAEFRSSGVKLTGSGDLARDTERLRLARSALPDHTPLVIDLYNNAPPPDDLLPFARRWAEFDMGWLDMDHNCQAIQTRYARDRGGEAGLEHQEFGIGLVGAGLISRQHLPAIRNTAGARLAGVFDVDPARSQTAVEGFDGAKAYRTADDLFADSGVDIAIIAVPNAFHHDFTIKAATAGKHILLEKPMSTSVASAIEMAGACKAAGITIRLAHNQRSSAGSGLARKLIADGILGDIHSFRSVFSETWEVVSINDYRWNLDLSGGATMMDLTVHRLDLVRYLIGGKYRSVSASLRHSAMPKLVDDNLHVIAEMDHGANGVFSSDRFSPAAHDSTEIYGTEGSLYLAQVVLNGFQTAPLVVYSTRLPETLPPELQSQARVRSHSVRSHLPHDGWFQLFPSTASAFEVQLRSFLALLRGEPPENELSTIEDGIHHLEVVHAAYTSQNERRWVDLPLPTDAPWKLPMYN